MGINIITAVSLNGVMGNKGKLPWKRIDIDLEHFFKTTVNNTVVMGATTFLDDLNGRSLYDRQNIVVSKSRLDYLRNYINIETASSPLEALELALNTEVFIVGGATLYQTFLPIAETMYYTHVLNTYKGNTYFPAVNWSEWELSETISSDELCMINKYLRK